MPLPEPPDIYLGLENIMLHQHCVGVIPVLWCLEEKEYYTKKL